MTWIKKLLHSAASAPAEVFILEELKASQGAPEPRVLVDDEEYISVVVNSLYIPFKRLQLTAFHGTVMSQISLTHSGTGEASFHVVTSPDILRSADAANLAKVIQLNQVLLDRVPYRGGRLKIEVGLFAEKSADLARPMVDVVSKVAGAAGVAFVSAAQPFMEPLRYAVDVLSGVPGAFTLLVAVGGSLDPVKHQYMAVIGTSRDKVDPATLKLRPGGFELVKADGANFTDAPYMVLSVEATRTKPDWTRIPELLAANKRVKDALTQSSAPNRYLAAQEAMGHFRLTVLTSPDLVFDDAMAIVKKALDRMDATLQAGVARVSAETEVWPDDLAAL